MNDHSLLASHAPLLFQIALDLFRRPSPSGQEDLVRQYTVEHLGRCGFAVSVDDAGNVLAVRGTPEPGVGYPLLSFHMDCVSFEASFEEDEREGRACSPLLGRRSSRRLTRPHAARQYSLRPLDALEMTHGWLHSRGAFVLGGDDKCGGAIALTLAATTSMPLKMVASVQEECGCVGIEQVDPHFFEDVAYALVLDRRGANHLIVSIGGQVLCQGAFAAAMMRAAATAGLLVYAAEGMLSDARTLAQYIPNVVNLSVGYYAPHTSQERVFLPDLWQSYRWVSEALQSIPCRFSYLDLRSSLQTEAVAHLVCPHCQKLTITPTDLSAELWRFVCQCAQSART